MTNDRANWTLFRRAGMPCFGLMLAAWWTCAPVSPAWASGGGHGGGHGESQEDAADELASHTFDLGSFELREVRPLRNEATTVTFSAYFKMAEKVSKQEIQQLEHWKHRLRDQVLIAVRTAQNKDFQEPDLARLRRIMLFRVRRLLKAEIVEDVLLSEFTFQTQQAN